MNSQKELLTLSPMLIKDLHEVYYIEQDVFPYAWTYPNFMSSVAQENQGYVLRQENNTMIGYFVAMEVVDELHLLKIAVAREFQNQGYGRFLMDCFFKLAKKLQMTSALLEVRESNHSAVKLYKNVGFTTIGVRKGYYVQPKEDALVMRRYL